MEETEDKTKETAPSSKSKSTGEKNIRIYDFRQTTIPKKQRELFRHLEEEFCEALTEFLKIELSVPTTVSYRPLEQRNYEELVTDPSNKCIGASFKIDPFDQQGIILIEKVFVSKVVQRILCEGDFEKIEEKALSPIDLNVFEIILGKILSVMNGIWESAAEVHFKLGQIKEEPHSLRVLAGVTPLLIFKFKIDMSGLNSDIAFAFPFEMIKGLGDEPPGPPALDFTQMSEADILAAVKGRFEKINVDMRAFFGELKLTLGELQKLETGDVIKLGQLRNGLSLKINGLPIMGGEPGIVNKNKGIEITSFLGNNAE